jgi:hypothetical protein
MSIPPVPRWRRFLFWATVGMAVALVIAGTWTLASRAAQRGEGIEELLAINKDLQEQLGQERAEDDTELRQGRCEEAYRRTVERNEALTFAAVLAALRAGSSPESVEAYDKAFQGLDQAVRAQDEYVRAGRPLPCLAETD